MNGSDSRWLALVSQGRAFQRLFQGTYARWEIAGAVRRQKAGENDEDLRHVVIPLAGDGVFDNAVWQRAAELATGKKLKPWPYPHGSIHWVEPGATLIAAERGGRRHEICLATEENWGARLAQHTGPRGFWEMLLWRLRHAGTLYLRHGMVYAANRSIPAAADTAIPCRDERDFFRLARTAWKSPRGRYERHADDHPRDWTRGMLPEWVPPGLAVYADPSRSPQLFDGSKPVPRRYAGKDGLPWIHA